LRNRWRPRAAPDAHARTVWRRRVESNTLPGPHRARLIGLQVDGLITGYPDRLRTVLADKGVKID